MHRFSTLLVVVACVALAACSHRVPPAEPAVLATVDGAPVTEAEVRKLVQGKLIELESQIYDVKKEGIDSVVTARLLDKEAKTRNTTVDDLLEQEVGAKVTEPSPAEVRTLYEQNKEQLNRPFEEVQEALVEHLHTQRVEAAREAYLRQLRAKATIAVHIKPPLVDVPGTGPAQGPANAPVTIIEFSDYQCPYCGRAEDSVTQVLNTYKDKVRLIYRDFPLAFHPFAQKAAEAARCAGNQGRYWEYHNKLFANQGALERPNLDQYAADLQLDAAKFKQCLDQNTHAQAVQQDQETGSSVGVNGTPAFFINGRFLSGAQPFEAFKEVIDEILKEKPAA